MWYRQTEQRKDSLGREQSSLLPCCLFLSLENKWCYCDVHFCNYSQSEGKVLNSEYVVAFIIMSMVLFNYYYYYLFSSLRMTSGWAPSNNSVLCNLKQSKQRRKLIYNLAVNMVVMKILNSIPGSDLVCVQTWLLPLLQKWNIHQQKTR